METGFARLGYGMPSGWNLDVTIVAREALARWRGVGPSGRLPIQGGCAYVRDATVLPLCMIEAPNVRIAEASIMPTITSAERAATLIAAPTSAAATRMTFVMIPTARDINR